MVHPPNAETRFHNSRVKVFQKMAASQLLLSSGVHCRFLHGFFHVFDVLVPSYEDDELDGNVDDHGAGDGVGGKGVREGECHSGGLLGFQA